MFDLNGFEVLLLALLLDAAIGDPAWMWRRIPHPVVLIGRFVSYLESTLNTGQHRRQRGIGAMVLTGVLAILVGEGIHRLPDHGIVEVLVAAVFLAHRNLVDEVKGVAMALRTSIAAGRAKVARIVGRDPDTLTSEGYRACGYRKRRGKSFRRGDCPGLLVRDRRPSGTGLLQGGQYRGQHDWLQDRFACGFRLGCRPAG